MVGLGNKERNAIAGRVGGHEVITGGRSHTTHT